MFDVQVAEVVIPRRFNGPPQSGHGGYVAGVLADLVRDHAVLSGGEGGRAVEVTLRKPPPLEEPLPVDRAGGMVRLRDAGGEVVAEGSPATLDLAIPDPPSAAAVASARAASPRLRPGAGFPTCVACGPQRAEGDGLRIFAGAVAGRDIVAAPWVPDASLGDAAGNVAARYLWTAIDCPSYAALDPGREPPPALLGRICATTVLPLRVGEPTTIIGWRLGEDGRKRHSASALYSQAGELCAYARTTWVVLR